MWRVHAPQNSGIWKPPALPLTSVFVCLRLAYYFVYRVFVEDNALLGFRGGQSGWLLPTLVSMSRGVRILADEVCLWWAATAVILTLDAQCLGMSKIKCLLQRAGNCRGWG